MSAHRVRGPRWFGLLLIGLICFATVHTAEHAAEDGEGHVECVTCKSDASDGGVDLRPCGHALVVRAADPIAPDEPTLTEQVEPRVSRAPPRDRFDPAPPGTHLR